MEFWTRSRQAQSSSWSTSRPPAGTPRRPPWSKSPRSRSRGHKIVDRWSTFVDPAGDLGNQVHGITDKDVKGAPPPADAASSSSTFAGDALLVGHNVGFDLGFLQGPGRRDASRPGPTWTRSSSRARPIRTPRRTSSRTSPVLRPRLDAEPPAPPDAEATAKLLIRLAGDLPGRIASYGGGRDSVRSPAKVATQAPARGGPPRGPLRRGPLRAASTRRPFASSCSTRGSAWTAATSMTIRPITRRSRPPAPHTRLGLFTRGETQALTVATLGPPRTSSASTRSARSREALHPPLQHAAVQHRREQADARPRPARDRPRRPRRARAAAGPPVAGGLPVRHPPRVASA